MQPGVEQRILRRDDIGEDGETAGLQHAPSLAQARAGVPPVVGAVATGHDVKAAVWPRQRLDRTLPRFDVGESASPGFRRHRFEHRGAEVIGDDAARQRRQCEGEVSAAAAKVDSARFGSQADQAPQRLEVLAAGMDGADDIGVGAGAELVGDEGIDGIGAASTLSSERRRRPCSAI